MSKEIKIIGLVLLCSCNKTSIKDTNYYIDNKIQYTDTIEPVTHESKRDGTLTNFERKHGTQ